jgi:hypothetical protein
MEETGHVTVSEVVPSSDFSSCAFLDEVLAARVREPELLKASKRDDFAFVQSWVDSRWPSKIEWMSHADLPHPGRAPRPSMSESIVYDRVVHNRAMDESDTAKRVTSIVVALLTMEIVDQFVHSEVFLLDGPGWDGAVLEQADRPSPHWRWSVEDGNHRILAQHLLGIGPYAIVRVPEYWGDAEPTDGTFNVS